MVSVLASCVEPFDISGEVETGENIENFLVVEATVTNEPKQQEVLLGRGRSFANDSLQPVTQNANVSVVDGNGNRFSFTETEPGRYVSDQMFQALPNTTYQLNIQTAQGSSYASELVSLPETATIAAVYAERIINDLGVEGIAIYVDSEIMPGEAPFLRYQYEETYKIIAPLWSPLDIVVTDPNPPYGFDLVAREQEERVCYDTRLSNRVIQATNLRRTGNQVNRNLVRFIPSDDFMISHRYSILVRQLAQAADAYSFYRTLNEQSGNQSLFTEIQPGFIEGNVSNTGNPNEKVLGFFEVANVSQERLFFNYDDFFPDEDLPPYAINCNFLAAPPPITDAGTSPLKDAVDSGLFVYIANNGGEVEGGPYLMARRACGDCTVLGSNQVPDFWTEE
ncbi:DUF4249 domain-containing protein [Maribacter sp. 2307ULW6-5]|uniref:DUF4249 domain-containing protein n=1 Tax=Maribacter sp. 2307ULW6-5 TaxID=3386275 RepID=UPI0039BC77B9